MNCLQALVIRCLQFLLQLCGYVDPQITHKNQIIDLIDQLEQTYIAHDIERAQLLAENAAVLKELANAYIDAKQRSTRYWAIANPPIAE